MIFRNKNDQNKKSKINRTNLLRGPDIMFRLRLIRGFMGQKYSNNLQSKNAQPEHLTKCHLVYTIALHLQIKQNIFNSKEPIIWGNVTKSRYYWANPAHSNGKQIRQVFNFKKVKQNPWVHNSKSSIRNPILKVHFFVP